MNLGFALRCICGAGLVAAAASLAAGALLPLFRLLLQRLAASAQARVCLLVAAAPAILALSLEAGWAIRFHLISPGVNHAGHQCPVAMTPLLLAAGALLGARLTFALGRAAASSWQSMRIVRALSRDSTETAPGLHLCPESQPQAFVAGLLRPRVFVSAGLLGAVDEPALSAILAHERAHVRRRDPLRRLLASLALAFHVPGVAAAVESLLARSHERAADAAAAGAVGDAPCVAETLVRVARLHLAAAPAAAHSAAIVSGDLEGRVRDLLFSERRPDVPGIPTLCAALMSLVAAAVIFAIPLHQAAETFAGLLGG